MPNLATNNPDVLTPEFKEVFFEQYDQLPSKLDQLYSKTDKGPKGNETKFSQVGTQSDWDEFNGNVTYEDITQGYDVTLTHKEFTKGFQLTRSLLDDDLTQIYSSKPKTLGSSYARTREGHAARVLNQAFAVDNFFYSHSEGVALCSSAHTTNTSASTAVGFDNLVTTALSATAVASARIQMRKYRDDMANKISVMPNEIWIPIDLYEVADEIVKSSGKLDGDLNNTNVHKGGYNIVEWEYMSDINNWFMMDTRTRQEMLFWIDRIPVEFGFVEDFDTLVAKWRGYSRYSSGYTDWRWILGAQVS